MNVRLTALIGLLFGMLFGTAVLADDAADCAGSDAAKIVSACTRMIQRPGAASKTVAEAYGKRGQFYLQQSQIDKALADLDEAIRRDPGIADAHHNRGVIYALQGDNQKALAALGEAIRLSPKTAAESYHTRGRIYGELGQWDKAMAEFDAALNRFIRCRARENHEAPHHH